MAMLRGRFRASGGGEQRQRTGQHVAVSIWHRGPGSPPIAVGLDDDIAVGIDVGWHRGPGSPPIDVGIL